VRTLNGLPAVVGERSLPLRNKEAPRFVLQCAVDAAGRITAVYSVVATAKLSAVKPIAA
jgi:RNA polymerase sigma-70 factor (ECF subfamily)